MWNSESQFADSFESYLKRRGEELGRQGKGTVVLREYDPGYGRVDMLMVAYDIDRLQDRRKLASCYPDCWELDACGAFAMAYLTHARWVSLKRLGYVINLGLTRTKQLVADLECRGLVETRAELVKARPRQLNLVIDYIETFELKLENWQRALEQAGRHLWFSSRSYIVMPSRSEVVTRRLTSDCIAWKIGAIFGESQEKWETVHCPPCTSIPTSHIGWLLNESIVSGVINA
jgi:hypothetical protein